MKSPFSKNMFNHKFILELLCRNFFSKDKYIFHPQHSFTYTIHTCLSDSYNVKKKKKTIQFVSIQT